MKYEPRGYTHYDRERFVIESGPRLPITAFSVDHARLIQSSALRRLGAKTQIQMAGTDDFSRTRLTHSLEVAQVGSFLAYLVGCDPDIVTTACLAHDLGHPPFGHTGEHVLAQIAKDIGSFEGNAQTFRLLTYLEPKIFKAGKNGYDESVGLNLTRSTLDAVLKYPWTYEQACAEHPEKEFQKFCIYPHQEEIFKWVKRDAPHPSIKSLEAQVMDISDDIAYSTHDVEDAIVSGAFNPILLTDPQSVDHIIRSTQEWYGEKWSTEGLREALATINEQQYCLSPQFSGSQEALARLKNVTTSFIVRFVHSIACATRENAGLDCRNLKELYWGHADNVDNANSFVESLESTEIETFCNSVYHRKLIRYSADIVIPQKTLYEITALKGIAVHFVMGPRELMPLHEQEKEIIRDLVNFLMADLPHPSSALQPQYFEAWERAQSDDERLRVAIDQVASLTDGSALALHSLLC